MRFYLISIISIILLLLSQETEALKLKSHEQSKNAIHRRYVRIGGGGGGYIGLGIFVCILIIVIYIAVTSKKSEPLEGDEIIEEVVVVEEHHDQYEGGTKGILKKQKIVKKRPLDQAKISTIYLCVEEIQAISFLCELQYNKKIDIIYQIHNFE